MCALRGCYGLACYRGGRAYALSGTLLSSLPTEVSVPSCARIDSEVLTAEAVRGLAVWGLELYGE